MTPDPPDDLDYYAILGVSSDASLAEIKSAYRALAWRYHPDRYALNSDRAWQAEIMMSLINRAYAVLSNSGQRHRYDEQRQQHAAAWTAKASSTAPGAAAMGGARLLSAAAVIQHLVKAARRWLSAQQAASSHKQMMGALSKMLLAPIPFCIAIIVSALFWQLGSVTGAMFLCGLSAVLAYPFILVPLWLRLLLPIRYQPFLSFRQKLVGAPIILSLAVLLGWVWVGVVDRHGSNPLDLYWWCGLIVVTCLSLACL
jgi:hypothetical protein